MTGIRLCAFEEVAASGLLELYANECAINGLPRPVADPARYKNMIAVNSMKVLGYFVNGQLTGFITIMFIDTPHYAKCCIASMESFFVHPDHRAGGAGLKLLKAAEDFAQESNAIGFMVSAPISSPLLDVLNRIKRYRMTNVVFIRGFNE